MKIAEEMEKGEDVSSLQEGSYCFVFQSQAKSLTLNIFAISPATMDLLALCDGSRNMVSIVGEMEKLLGREHLEVGISKIVQHLQTIGVLGV